jgi:hypothetical protein
MIPPSNRLSLPDSRRQRSSRRFCLPITRLEEIAEQYLESLLAGEGPDRRAIVDAHPDIASELDRRLSLVDLLYAARPGPTWPR